MPRMFRETLLVQFDAFTSGKTSILPINPFFWNGLWVEPNPFRGTPKAPFKAPKAPKAPSKAPKTPSKAPKPSKAPFKAPK